MCVVNLDHHCPFVNNCVGRGNRRMFVLFTLFASMVGQGATLHYHFSPSFHYCKNTFPSVYGFTVKQFMNNGTYLYIHTYMHTYIHVHDGIHLIKYTYMYIHNIHT